MGNVISDRGDMPIFEALEPRLLLSTAPFQVAEAWVEPGSGTDQTVHYRAYDPNQDVWKTGSTYYEGGLGGEAGVTIRDLTVSEGIVAWRVDHWNSVEFWADDEEAVFAVYDPIQDTWRTDNVFYSGDSLANESITDLTVSSGVVAWRVDSWFHDPPYSTHYGEDVAYSIYDPVQGQWKTGGSYYNGDGSIYWPTVKDLTVDSGMVAWRVDWGAMGVGGLANEEVGYAIYDPSLQGPGDSAWRTGDHTYWGDLGVWTITDVAIRDQSVEWAAIHSSGMTDEGSVGYNFDDVLGWGWGWRSGQTDPMAYFYASPTSGDPPLSVWFWDMSIGGASWSLDFADGSSTTTGRSALHEFDWSGKYAVTQTVTGPAGSDSSNVTITVGSPVQFADSALEQAIRDQIGKPEVRHTAVRSRALGARGGRRYGEVWCGE